MKRLRIGVPSRVLIAAVAILSCLFVFGGSAIAFSGDDTPTLRPGAMPKEGDEAAEARLRELDIASTDNRTAGDNPLDVSHAGELRRLAARAARKLARHAPGDGPHTFAGEWSSLGPNPIVTTARSDGAFYALSGRIGALAIRPSNGEFILGGAQGGIWTMDAGLRNMDAADERPGNPDDRCAHDRAVQRQDRLCRHGRRSALRRQHVRRRDPQVDRRRHHVDAASPATTSSASAVLAHRRRPDGSQPPVRVGPPRPRRRAPRHPAGALPLRHLGVDRRRRQLEAPARGARSERGDRPRDRPAQPEHPLRLVLGRRDLQEHGRRPALGEVDERACRPATSSARTRVSRSRSRIRRRHIQPCCTPASTGTTPTAAITSPRSSSRRTAAPTGARPEPARTTPTTSRTTAGRSASTTTSIEVDPTNPNIVYAGGSFGYDLSPQSGGIFRSTDGGASWVNLGWDLHPDFHALAIDPSEPGHVLIGNDGGVWYSPDRGGRPTAAQPLSATPTGRT